MVALPGFGLPRVPEADAVPIRLCEARLDSDRDCHRPMSIGVRMVCSGGQVHDALICPPCLDDISRTAALCYCHRQPMLIVRVVNAEVQVSTGKVRYW